MREMKDSGVAWIGEIPVNWTTLRLKNLHDGMNTGEAIDKGFWTDDENDCIFYTAGVVPIHTNYKKFPEWKYTGENDILLARNGTPYVYFPFTNSCYTDHIIRVKLKDNTNRKYIQYSLQQSIANVVVETVSIATWSGSLWNEQFIAYPPLPEQQKIASLLDKKCTQIDTLISNQQQQIEKLKAYKQSLITEVVTKGLNPDVPMKDSGAPWIGEIPESWEIVQLSSISKSMRNGYVGPTKDLFHETGVKYIQSLHIKNGKIIFSRHEYYVSEKWAEQKPKIHKGDLLIVQTGAELGQIGVVTEEYDNCNCHALIIVEVNNNLFLTEFLSYYFRSYTGKELLLANKTGALLPHLNSGKIGNTFITFPPLTEQQTIVTYLDKKCSEIDSLIAIKQQKIEKLQQYKKSVIYEYVTEKKEVE